MKTTMREEDVNSSKATSIKDLRMDIKINGETKLLTPDEKEMKPDVKDDLPDGGWAWIVVFGSFMCNVVLDGIVFSYGILLIPLLQNFDSSRTIISNGGSIMTGVYLMSSPISGALINKFGCRNIGIFGCVLAALGIGLSTLSPNLTVFMITYGLIGGWGLGTMYLPTIVVISEFFDKKRGLATGIADSGSGVGVMLFAPMTAILVENYGWEGAHLAFGGFCLASVLFASLMGPLKSECMKKERNIKMDDYIVKTDDMKPKKSPCQTFMDTMDFSIIANPMFLLVAVTNMIACLGFFIPYFYLPDLAVEKNFTKEESSYLISAIGVINTFGRIGTCWISDIPWLNSLWSCVVALFITGITLVATPFCTSYAEFMTVALFYGFFSASLQMNPVIMIDLLGVEKLSLALGYNQCFKAIGILAGPPIAGALYDGTLSYNVPFFLAGGCFVLSGLVLTIAAIFQKPPVGKTKNDVKDSQDLEKNIIVPSD